MNARRVALTGLVVALAAAALGVVQLRSFEFLTWPGVVAPWAPPDGAGGGRGYLGGVLPAARTVSALTLVIVDGLRVDVAADLPNLKALSARSGEPVRTLRAEFPSFSRVGYATMLTGAGPREHGYLSNHNRRPSPILSVVDAARRAGVRTRILSRFADGRGPRSSWIAAMFPDAFDEKALLDEPALAMLRAPPGERRLTVVYFAEPDLTAHERGGASEECRRAAGEVDGWIGRIAAALDLERAALIVTSDHGHLDRGGHGGPEDVVLDVPLVVAGPPGVRAPESTRELHVESTLGPRRADGRGAAAEPPGGRRPPPTEGGSPERIRRLRHVAPLLAGLLGLEVPTPARAARTWDTSGALAARGVIVLLALGALGRALRGVRPRDLAFGFASLGLYAAIYAARGWPFSFSVLNSSQEMPGFVVTTLAMSGLSLIGAALAARGWPRFQAGAMLAGASVLGACFAACGPTAATALERPLAAYLYIWACGFLIAAGLCGLVAGARGSGSGTGSGTGSE